ncbi:response regulator transcription factor [Caballeronia pedi]|uniref:response regulator transcription factor n=1 Tax=Caballeronia pedi TaxID=1777141 RepID=UPI0007729413|nr:response regulator transcription factor [Caballeronia pedi]
MSIKVIAADSHPVTALGIETVLRQCSGVTVIGILRSAIEISSLAATNAFNVIVMDKEAASKCIGGTTIPLIKLILDEFPGVGVVLHSCARNAAYVATLSQLGVHAMLDEDDVIMHLHVAIRVANARANYISPKLAEMSVIEPLISGDVRPLSRCEIHVIRSVLSGHSVKEISLTRFRSKQTISTHKKNAMRKLQVTSDAELFRAFSEDDFVLVELTCADNSRN